MGRSAVTTTNRPDTIVAEHLGATRTVLLVEDDPLVAEACAMLLEDFGYSVKRAETAERALEVVTSGETVDVVFSDIVMPGTIGGVELAQILRQRCPRLPVLLTSGFSKTAAQAVKKGFQLLPKPYLPTDLRRMLEAALASAQPNPGTSS